MSGILSLLIEVTAENMEGRDLNTEGSGRASHLEGKYLTFTLEGEEYGVGILKIREIINMMPVTALPQTPDYVKGVINLRGKVIPVVDLRLKSGLEEAEYTERTCIIVVEISNEWGDAVTGIIVDGVSEVLNIKAQDIEGPPSFGTGMDVDFILGMAKKEGGVKILLDIDRLLSAEDMGRF